MSKGAEQASTGPAGSRRYNEPRRAKLFVGRLTQRLECYPHTVEVTGSNPVPPTQLKSFAARKLSEPSGGRKCGLWIQVSGKVPGTIWRGRNVPQAPRPQLP